jgi:hypothetical protein
LKLNSKRLSGGVEVGNVEPDGTSIEPHHDVFADACPEPAKRIVNVSE